MTTNHLQTLTDPIFNHQYRQINQNRPYGRSGIQFLPEALLYFLASVAGGRIDLHANAPRILDYGCGNSLMLDAMCHILDKNILALQFAQDNATPLDETFAILLPDIKRALKTKTIIKPYKGHLVRPVKFDPALPEYRDFPSGHIDFITCTDVLEHIPERSDINTTFPLSNTIRAILKLTPNVYLNISTRLAAQILPNGKNAHCTLLSPDHWHHLLQYENIKHYPLTPVLSRDTTSCAFYYGPPSDTLKSLQYTLLAQFGAIDLIPFPAPADMPAEKIAKLQGLQPHKIATQSRYIQYWLKNDPDCINNPAFRAMAASQMQTRVNKPKRPNFKPS